MKRKRGKIFPWDSVNACRTNKVLQSHYSVEDAKAKYVSHGRLCPKCNATPAKLCWVYYASNPELLLNYSGIKTWKDLVDASKDHIWITCNNFVTREDLVDASDDQMSIWITYKRITRGWLTICDLCKWQIDFFDETDWSFFHIQDIIDSYKNMELQKQKSITTAKAEYLNKASSCLDCGTAPDQLIWFYFKTPDLIWKLRIGRAGWLTICPGCIRQVDFFCEVMS